MELEKSWLHPRRKLARYNKICTKKREEIKTMEYLKKKGKKIILKVSVNDPFFEKKTINCEPRATKDQNTSS